MPRSGVRDGSQSFSNAIKHRRYRLTPFGIYRILYRPTPPRPVPSRLISPVHVLHRLVTRPISTEGAQKTPDIASRRRLEARLGASDVKPSHSVITFCDLHHVCFEIVPDAAKLMLDPRHSCRVDRQQCLAGQMDKRLGIRAHSADSRLCAVSGSGLSGDENTPGRDRRGNGTWRWGRGTMSGGGQTISPGTIGRVEYEGTLFAGDKIPG